MPDNWLQRTARSAAAATKALDANPLENIDWVTDPHKNFVVIMKDGKIYKNTLK